MILDRISNITYYTNLYPSIQKIIEFLDSATTCNIAPGTYELDGKQIYAVIQEYSTVPSDTLFWEYHKKYIDIQCILDGEEDIYWTTSESLTDCDPYDENTDSTITYCTSIPSIPIYLTAGHFAILAPQDAHKPKCTHNTCTNVKKIVFKLAI